MRRSTDNQKTAREGRSAVAAEMICRGIARLEVLTANNTKIVRVTDSTGRSVDLHVKSRKSGTWQGSITAGSAQPPRAAPPRFWIFVDLGSDPVGFFIVPDRWMRRNIHQVHQTYLKRHGGRRLLNPKSRHHAIEPHRIERWRSKWELLGLGIVRQRA